MYHLFIAFRKICQNKPRDLQSQQVEHIFSQSQEQVNMNIYMNLSYESAMKRQWTAMARQDPATQGLNLSPMRASFQKLPRGPVLFLDT